ncbi:MAG: hypothetical protein R3D80_14330 [Paracoccaceae bacterium]
MTDLHEDTLRAIRAGHEILDGRDPVEDMGAILVTLDHVVASVLIATMAANPDKARGMLHEGLAPAVEERIMLYAARHGAGAGRAPAPSRPQQAGILCGTDQFHAPSLPSADVVPGEPAPSCAITAASRAGANSPPTRRRPALRPCWSPSTTPGAAASWPGRPIKTTHPERTTP